MLKPIKIGKVTIDIPICLSPMAGTSTVTYRRICHEFGAGFCPTELSSARSVRFSGVDKGFRYMRIDPEGEGVTSIQLFGNDPEDFDYAIKAIMEDERLNRVSMFDINMGCPVTVKTRIGFDRPGESRDLVKAVLDSGADMICVHGRTRVQMYSGKADWNELAVLSEMTGTYGIPFFANGDICDTASANKVIEQTGCAGIMIGRQAMGNPWLFARLASDLTDHSFDAHDPTPEERVAMLIRHLKEECRVIREEVAVKEFRSVMPAYIKGIRGAAQIRMHLVSAKTVAEVEDILNREVLGTRDI